METRRTRAAVCCALVAGFGLSVCAQPDLGPKIKHEPVSVGVKGQPISILASVKPGGARIKSVTLHYAPSRDASPLKLLMTPSGGGMYVGSIPAEHLSNATSISYYIEAVDDRDEWADTNWHEVQIRPPRPTPKPAVIHRTQEQDVAPATVPAPTPARTPDPDVVPRSATATASSLPVDSSRPKGRDGTISSKTLLVGGAVAVGAAVAIAAASGGGGGGESTDNGTSPTGTTDPACTDSDAVGTWLGDPVSAPGFALTTGNVAQFLNQIGLPPVVGSWSLVDCNLTLIPPLDANTIYNGTGALSADKTTVTINGVTFRKGI